MAITIPLFSSTLSSSSSSSSSSISLSSSSKLHSPSRTSSLPRNSTSFAIRSSYSGNGSSPDAFNSRFFI